MNMNILDIFLKICLHISLSFTTKSLYIENKNQLILSLLVITQHRNCEKKKKKLKTENEGVRQVFLLKKSFH